MKGRFVGQAVFFSSEISGRGEGLDGNALDKISRNIDNGFCLNSFNYDNIIKKSMEINPVFSPCFRRQKSQAQIFSK